MDESNGHYVMLAADPDERITLRCVCGWVHLLGVRPTPHDALVGSLKHHMHPEGSDA